MIAPPIPPSHAPITATRKKFVLLLAALALLLPLTGWMVVQIRAPQVEREAYANLAAIARLKTDQIENWLGERQKNGELLSGDREFARHVAQLLATSATRGPDHEAVLRRFTQLRTIYDYDRIELLDLGGHVAAPAAAEPAGVPASLASAVQQVLASGQVVRMELDVNAAGQAQLQWLLPVLDANGPPHRPIALVRMSVSPDRFLFPAIQTWPTSSPSGETLLVNREGNMAVFMNELRHRSGSAMKLRRRITDPSLPAVVALNSSQPGIVSGSDYRGVAVLTAFRPVAGTAWRVVAKIDQAEVLAPVQVLAWWVGGVTLVAMVALALVLALFWRQLRRAQRLELLAEKVRSDQVMERFFSLPFIGIATGDLTGPGWSRFNDYFCTIVGYPAAQLDTLGWSDLLDPADLLEDMKGYEQLMRGETDAYAVDRRIRRGDGTEAFVSLQLRVLTRPDGPAPHCIFMLQDITQRRLAELKIRRQSQLYAVLSECNQAIVQCTSKEQLFARICQTAVDVGGLKMAWIGLLDARSRRVLPVASFGSCTDALEGIEVSASADSVFGRGSAGTAIREDRPVWIQDFPNAPSTAAWHAIGARSNWRATAAIPLHAKGQSIGVFVLVADEENAFDEDARNLITEMASDIDFALENFEHEAQRQRTEQLLLKSQTQLALALKGSSDAPWDWDLVTQQLDYSPQGWHMLGYGAHDTPITPGPWAALVHPQDMPLMDQLQQQVVESGASVTTMELRLRHKDGHYVPVLSRGFVTRDETGRPVRVTGTHMDLTAQHQARQIDALRPFALELMASDQEIEPILLRLVQKLAELLPASVGAAWLLAQPAGELSTGVTAVRLAEFLDQMRAALGIRQDAGQADHERKLIDMVDHFMGIAVQQKASEAQERLAAQVFSQSQDGITITNARGNILLVNPAFSQITGYSKEEVLGRNSRILSSGRHGRDFYASLWHSLQSQGAWQGEIWNRRKSGEVYPQWLNISRMNDARGEATNYVAIFTDISQKKSDEERIKWMAHFDPLTALPNRALLADRFAYAQSMAQRSGESMALLFVDLDHFKNINDSLGHGAGDELLVGVARRMRQQLREQDTVARMGGDEFVVVLPGTDANGAAHLAQKLIAAIAQPFVIESHELIVTPSIGIAMYPQDGQTLESLAQYADVAMYRAKQDGRNTYRFFAPDMQLHSARTLLLEGALRRALERNQLYLHYQPQLCLQTGRVIGVEALLRWNHPELGQVSPAEFIPIAERCGLILPIGEWVLHTAAQQLSSWIRAGLEPIIMAVNVSAVQFRHPNLPELVSRILEGAAVLPQYLELELTESVASEDPRSAIAIMADLRARGVRMSIDDFGTGYSSLSYLKQFQVYKLKIDQSFVRDITVDPEDRAIVSAIISMARSLGLQTIAEGVETLEQLDFLRAQGCDEVQGYFCSRPLAAPDCERYLRSATVQAPWMTASGPVPSPSTGSP